MKLEELKEGMYIRTLLGNIYKIQDEEFEIKQSAFTGDILYKKNNEFETITKASYNIIDLIEEGDYVNGYKIDYINLNCETPFLRSNQPYRVDNTLYSTLIEKGKDYNQPLHFYEEDIKSIVTKEQFNSMKYEVDSNE